MNQLSKDIIKTFNNWYKTCKVYSKALHSKNVTIETIEATSKVITDQINKIDIEGSEQFKSIYIGMIGRLIIICKKQSKIYGNNQIPLKVFKHNIKTITDSFKKGYKEA